MVKEELISAIAEDTGYRRTIVSEVVDSMLRNITQELSRGNKVRLSKFGTFEPTERAARTGRNPRTREPVPIPARTVPTFKPGERLKSAVIKEGCLINGL